MTTTRVTLFLSCIGMLGMSACRGKPACLECDDAVAEADDDDGVLVPDLPDLPCGGADLMTDSLNCGTCGHECVLEYAETEYQSGTCKAGVCGPLWTNCDPGPGKTCSEVCSLLGHTCVDYGCSGKTGMLFDVLFGNGCADFPPDVTLSGGCDEPVPWTTPALGQMMVMCCCDFQ